MSDRIDPMTQGMLGKIAERAQGAAGPKKADGAPAGGREAGAPPRANADTVELTASARLLERLEKSLDSVPEIDRARVEAVKTAIRNGDYEIDADKIAAALIRTDRHL